MGIKFYHLDPSAKNQAKSKPPVTLIIDPSELKGCLNVPSDVISSGGFDENIVITFSVPLLGSPVTPNLNFMDQAVTPQSKFFAPGDISNRLFLCNKVSHQNLNQNKSVIFSFSFEVVSIH